MTETRLSADTARDITCARRDVFDKTLGIIRNMVDVQIKDAAKLGKHSILVEVPRSVFGRGPYVVSEMGAALANQLHADGFNIKGTFVRMQVSWEQTTPAAPPPTQRHRIVNVPVPKRK